MIRKQNKMADQNYNKDIDCFDYVSNAYLVYGSNVNTSRAFPSIYDGLKPVQRKVLLSANEVANNKEVSSANIVGNCISNRHPHGDCLLGSTKVLLTNYKTFTIEELTESHKAYHEIFAFDSKTGNIVKAIAHDFRVVKKDNLWLIKLSDGGEIRCSGNHPILMCNKTYKKTENLKPGDIVFSTELIKKEIQYTIVSVISVQKISDDEIMLYDFTVDNLENMFIMTGKNTMVSVHNSGVYQAMVNMVTAEDPVLSGHGAFGYKGGLVEIEAAHMRYTAAGLNQLGSKMFCEYIDYVEKEENELYNLEPKYLPTPVPYALLNGASGIGLGATTNIPAFTIDSLKSWISRYLKTGKTDSVLVPKYSFIEDEIELKNLNETGVSALQFYAKVEKSKDNKSVLVSEFPTYIQPSRLLKEFKVELQSRLVSIIQLNDSNNKPIVKIEKTPHVRSINIEDIYTRTQKCMTKSVKFKTVVTDGKKAYIFGPQNWMKFTLDCYLSFVSFGLQKELLALKEDILFNTIKKDLADLFLQKKSNEEIAQILISKGNKVSTDMVQKWSRKSISTLRSDEVPVEDLLKKAEDVQNNLNNLNKYTLDKINSILK